MGWDEVPPQQFWQPLGSRREQEIPARSLSQAPLAASQGAALGKQLPEPFPRCEGLLGRGRQELLGCPAGSRACSARLQAGSGASWVKWMQPGAHLESRELLSCSTCSSG